MTKIRAGCPFSKLFELGLIQRPVICFNCRQLHFIDCEICCGLAYDINHVP